VRRHRAVSLGLLLTAAACVSPVLNFAAYEDKALDTARSALSEARTAILAAELARTDRLFGPTISIQLQEAEIGATSTRDTFASIQPPDDASDVLRAQLLPMLDEAEELVSQMRIAARRGDTDDVVRLAGLLTQAAEAIERFEAQHA
jgi:hypothetical protein